MRYCSPVAVLVRARTFAEFRYYRYAGEVRSGDLDLYRSPLRYSSGTEVEIRFDGTKKPMTVSFFNDGASVGDPVELNPKHPSKLLHLVACLDENNDAIEILELKATSRSVRNAEAFQGNGVSSKSLCLAYGAPVVRGPGWWPCGDCNEDEDGGVGNIGHVVRIVPPFAPSICGEIEVWWRGSPAHTTKTYVHSLQMHAAQLQAFRGWSSCF